MASQHEAPQYVGVDLHRRRSVIVRRDIDGEVLEQVRIDNDPVALACESYRADVGAPACLSTAGWDEP